MEATGFVPVPVCVVEGFILAEPEACMVEVAAVLEEPASGTEVLLKSVALPVPSCCILNVEPPIVKFCVCDTDVFDWSIAKSEEKSALPEHL